MASKNYIDYTINLTDKDLVATLQAAPAIIHSPRNVFPGDWFNPKTGVLPDERGFVYGAPDAAAIRFTAPVVATNERPSGNCITSTYIGNGLQTNYPTNVDSVERKAGGWLGIISVLHPTIEFVWRGSFAYVPAVDAAAGEAIQQLAWADGFEHPEQGANGSGAGGGFVARGSSRHADGYGFAIRGNEHIKLHTVVESGGAARASSWERIYFRIVKMPTGNVTFWRARSSISNAAGPQLAVNSVGRLVLTDTDASNVQTPVATTTDAYELMRWYKADIQVTFGDSSGLKLVIDGETAIDAISLTLTGAGIHLSTHASSEVGGQASSASKNLGLDLDDWTNATAPALETGIDYKNGTKIRRVDATGFEATTGAWTGDWRAALQTPALDVTAHLNSATSADPLTFETNAEHIIDHQRGAIGCIGISVGIFSSRATAGNGTMGISIAGVAVAPTTMVESASIKWNWTMYRPSGLITPAEVTPVLLQHVKAANTNAAVVQGCVASAAMIGVFGPEDVTDTDDDVAVNTVLGHTGYHNSAYPTTPWAQKGSRPISAFVIFSGTYTGNDVGQDLTFRLPIHWLYIRRVTARTGTDWWTSMLAAHATYQESPRPAGMVQATIDPAFVPAVDDEAQGASYILRLTGDDSDINASGVTYEYIAVSDAGMRFMLNDVVKYCYGTADQTTTLVNALFVPETAFAQQEVSNGASSTAAFMKGLGHAVDAIQGVGATAPVTGMRVSSGQVVTKSALHLTGGQQIALNMWRRDDHSADPGLPNALWMMTYTGDGTGARTLTVQALSTVRPLFAMIQPANAAAFYRDPSHTGTTSTTVQSGANAATGIVGGGIGQILVGSALNANGIVYSVFCIPGGETAGNAGWSADGEFEPVVPAIPADLGPFLEDPGDDIDFDDAIGEGADSGGTGVGGDDLGTGCLAASTQVCNRALSHIGITKLLVNLDTEDNVEAEQCRLAYADEVDAVLRKFPWPWATKYATLALVDGDDETPVNDDWQYAYRKPTDCVFARRLLDGQNLRRTVDYEPPPFREGVDNAGKLVYANLADAVLEYTFRPSCAALAGDALFRDALSWKIAAILAPALARNKVTAADCLAVYDRKITEAAFLAAREKQDNGDPFGDAEWIRGR